MFVYCSLIPFWYGTLNFSPFLFSIFVFEFTLRKPPLHEQFDFRNSSATDQSAHLLSTSLSLQVV